MQEGSTILHWGIYWEGSSYLTSEEVVLFVLVNVLMPESSSLSSPLSVEWKTQFGVTDSLLRGSSLLNGIHPSFAVTVYTVLKI